MEEKAATLKDGSAFESPPMLTTIRTRNQRRELVKYPVTLIEDFLWWLVRDHRLPIGETPDGSIGIGSPLTTIGPDTTFLVAMTGVGKSLTVPIWELLLCCRHDAVTPKLKEERRVYVVEPRITICQGNERHLNHCWGRFLESRGHDASGFAPLFRSITSSGGTTNREAPIAFVTTGILDAMFAGDQLSGGNVRLVIDEAHVTIEQNAGIELCIALARRRSVPLSYMSATVDTGGVEHELRARIVVANAVRFPVVRRLVPGGCIDRAKPAESEKTVLSLVERYLLNPTRTSLADLRGQSQSQAASLEKVRRTLVDEARERPVGMLIIVNSHQSENSDTRFVSDMIECAPFNRDIRRVEVLRLAAPIVRDADDEAHFRHRLRQIEARRGRYVIVATNVVEMGVTLESVDIVVSLDSEIETVVTPEGSYIRKRPLSVNALFQRAGRAGRKRPGLCLVVRDVGAAYTTLSDVEFDANLQYEPIRYPFEGMEFERLAFESYRDRAPDVRAWLEDLDFPSRRREGDAWVGRALPPLERSRKKMRGLGLTDGVALSERGHSTASEFASVGDARHRALLALALEVDPSLVPPLLLIASAPLALRALVQTSATFARHGCRLLRQELFTWDELCGSPELIRGYLDRTGAELASTLMARGVAEEVAMKIVTLRAAGYSEASESDVDVGQFLVLEKEPVQLSRRSDLVSIYDVVRYFGNRYLLLMRDPFSSDLDKQALRLQAESEARDFGVKFTAIDACYKAFQRLYQRASRGSMSRTVIPASPVHLAAFLRLVFRGRLLSELRDAGIDVDAEHVRMSEIADAAVSATANVCNPLAAVGGAPVLGGVSATVLRRAVGAATEAAEEARRGVGSKLAPPILQDLQGKGAPLVNFAVKSGVFPLFELNDSDGWLEGTCPASMGKSRRVCFSPADSPLQIERRKPVELYAWTELPREDPERGPLDLVSVTVKR